MKKSMRYWAIGIILAFIVLLLAVFTSAGRIHVRKSGQSAPSSGSAPGAVPASLAEHVPGLENRNLDNVSAEDNVNRYVSRQTEIMADMVQAMEHIQETGNASIDFLNAMALHHEASVLMAEAYLSYGGSDETLKSLAEQIVPARQEEIVQMKKLSEKYGSEGHFDTDKEKAYLEDYSNLLDKNRKAESPDNSSLDHAFADGMRNQHQMAAEMARSILDYTDYEEIRTLAQGILSVQEQEISRMGDFLQ
ncbi:DUF305 domain-containing protein [Lachnospiraceae bacterium 54-53]